MTDLEILTDSTEVNVPRTIAISPDVVFFLGGGGLFVLINFLRINFNVAKSSK